MNIHKNHQKDNGTSIELTDDQLSQVIGGVGDVVVTPGTGVGVNGNSVASGDTANVSPNISPYVPVAVSLNSPISAG